MMDQVFTLAHLKFHCFSRESPPLSLGMVVRRREPRGGARAVGLQASGYFEENVAAHELLLDLLATTAVARQATYLPELTLRQQCRYRPSRSSSRCSACLMHSMLREQCWKLTAGARPDQCVARRRST